MDNIHVITIAITPSGVTLKKADNVQVFSLESTQIITAVFEKINSLSQEKFHQILTEIAFEKNISTETAFVWLNTVTNVINHCLSPKNPQEKNIPEFSIMHPSPTDHIHQEVHSIKKELQELREEFSRLQTTLKKEY